jgi:hypothetical protein
MAARVRVEDTVEDAYIRVNEEMRTEFGVGEAAWTPDQVREYLIRLDAARFDPAVVA